jgi:predicted transcriptional regulator
LQNGNGKPGFIDSDDSEILFPCEIAAKYVLPAIRAALAIVLTEEYGFTSYRVAKLLNLTPAAITNYKKGKRGIKLIDQILNDPRTRKHIEDIASAISNQEYEPELFHEKTCSICKIVRGVED